MLRTYLFVSLGLLLTFFAQGQAKRFYDGEGKEVDSVDSYYYTLSLPDAGANDLTSISYYTKTNSIFYNEGPKNAAGFRLRTYFYPDGVVKLEGLFKHSFPVGQINSYYQNSHPQAEIIYEDREPWNKNDQVIGIINYWDSLGNRTVSSGNGFCRCILAPFLDKVLIESGRVENGVKVGEWKGRETGVFDFVESYDNGILVRGVQHYQGQRYEYTKIEVWTEPAGGGRAFYEYVGKKMKYPVRARRKSIEGKVYVEFVVDKEGNLTNGKIVKGIDKECDQEALNAVMSSPKWIPGNQRGRPVKQRYTLPIIFKLR